MTRVAALALATAAALGCAAPGPPILHREGEPAVVQFSENDPRMAAAIREAQATLDVFIERLNAPTPWQRATSIKAGFATPGGAE